MKPHHLRKLSLYCFRVMNNNMYHQSVRCQIICSFSSDYKSIITSIIHFSINERLINRTKQVIIMFEVITIQIQLLSLTLSQTHTHTHTHTHTNEHTHTSLDTHSQACKYKKLKLIPFHSPVLSKFLLFNHMFYITIFFV